MPKPQSQFSRKLAANPALAAQCAAVVKRLQRAAAKEIHEAEQSEELSQEDFAVYVNAKAEHDFVMSH